MNFSQLSTNDALIRGIGAGIIATCIMVLGALGFYFLMSFLTVPIFYVGLRDGTKIAAIAVLVAFIFISFLNGFYVGLLITILLSAPALYLSYRATTHYGIDDQGKVSKVSLTLLILDNLMIGLVIMAVYFAFMSSVMNHEVIQKLITSFETTLNIRLSDLNLTFDKVVRTLRLVPGIMGLAFFMTFALNGMIAQNILIKQHKNLRPKDEDLALELPFWLWIVLGSQGVLAIIFQHSIIGDLTLNVVLVLLGAFMIQGISVFHALSNKTEHKKISLIVFYCLIFLPWFSFVIITVGVFEPWLKLRQRILN